ncbi:chemotaxis protein MotA [Modestobacter sp. DSM 44400]|uniref:flagellar motor protein n=1 Tax=Modestobacter sp. DSM 44400 TaxID=1550230 RepID=UPI0008993569|nr:flagellar motor protein [Modestobacter sp. DSM 44400]SDX87620.1 chemotaxis protein MotA [Modestobacter sp. DSM 44400]
MDPATLIGFGLATVALLVTMIMEGSSPMAIILLPPMLLVFGGTFGAAIAGSTMTDVKKIGGWFKMAALPPAIPPVTERIQTLVKLAEKARKEGLLALEAEVKSIDDPFLKRGLQMSIDGTDPEDLRAIMEGEIAAKKAEDKVAAKFFNAMGGYAPTIGIIGTVVGLIHVLENLSNPDSLGPLIAGAFVATLWGVLSANVFWLPMGAKITRTSDLQAAQMELLVEGIAEIQAGTSPRTVRQKLTSLVPPGEQQREAA